MESIAAAVGVPALLVVAAFLKLGDWVGVLSRRQQRIAERVQAWAVIAAVLLAPAAAVALVVQHYEGVVTEITRHMLDSIGPSTTTTQP